MQSLRVETLSSRHDRESFASGSEALDRYFRNQASQDVRRRIATCFVAVDEKERIAGYYTLAATSVALTGFSESTVKRLPRYPVVPAALLGRLAVDLTCQGRGIGGLLLADAIRRISRVEMGVFALVVDAKDDNAQRFYEHFGFVLLPDQDRRLCLPMDDGLRRLAAK